MATMSVACRCGRTLQVKPESAGHRLKCPFCGGVIEASNAPVPTGAEQMNGTGPQSQAKAANPPPISVPASSPVPAVDRRAPTFAGHSLPVWITVGVLNLCVIAVAIAVVLSLRSPRQTTPLAAPVVGRRGRALKSLPRRR
jgi:hypothetical protein